MVDIVAPISVDRAIHVQFTRKNWLLFTWINSKTNRGLGWNAVGHNSYILITSIYPNIIRVRHAT